MAKLNSQERKELPRNAFGLPSERKYPIEDKGHARNAKARASEAEHEGRISATAEEKIDSRADRVMSSGAHNGYGR